jgi:saccharopine dehydrogenase-like NADP-dependent oxidoreductase
LLKTCDIAISLVPAPFHPNIARACIKHKKHLITSSYISPEMRALDTEAKNNDLIFLNECGLDPGLDHIITMKLLEQIKSIDAE